MIWAIGIALLLHMVGVLRWMNIQHQINNMHLGTLTEHSQALTLLANTIEERSPSTSILPKESK